MDKDYNTKKRGRPARPISDPSLIVKSVTQFLQMFMPDTLTKRVLGLLLIAVGVPNIRITELTGLKERSIWNLKKAIHGDALDSLFTIEHGGGRPGKAKGIENAITEELEKNNYHTRQQIVDMIFEKFGIRLSVCTVGRLLKKTVSGD